MKRLAAELNIEWLSLNRINGLAKELEMLGSLKCSYARRRDGRVSYVRFLDPALIPKYASMLKEGLEKARIEKEFGIL